jgi:hypothetical protein
MIARPLPTTNSDPRASPTATQVRAAAKTPAKTRTLVQATNDKNMFISGHKPAPKRLVSSSAGRRSTPKSPPSAPPRQPVKTSLDMPSEAPRRASTTTTTTTTTASASVPAPAGGEEDDTVGELRVRVGRIDAWREQGFASAREQREHHRSDLFRYNQRRKRAGRAPVTESEFQAMLEGGDEVSSISGSDDSDSDDSDDDDDDDSNAATKNLRALHGKAEGAQVVCVGDDGVPFGVWRCLLRPDATKAADADATKAANVTPEEALRALRSDPSRPWVVLLARGGHFAGAVFDPRKLGGGSGADERQQKGGEGVRGGPLALVPPACAVAHKTFHRYVVRAKAGGRQSVKDQGGKTIKSAGSSIRRANEAALQREVLETLETWRERLNDAALVFVAASATDQRTLFEGKNPPLSRRDPRVRRIPFATQRPTFNEARRVMARLATVNYKMVETDGANEIDTRGGSVRSSDETKEGTKHRQDRREEEDGVASAGALTPAQAARLAAMNARAAEAAAEAAAAMRLDEHLDEQLDEHRAEEIKILSKKEKEKLKKARAKERQKAEKAAERAANGSDDETDAKTDANGVLEGTSSAPSKATKAAKTATAKGGKAAALLAKAKQAEVAKRDEKVRECATTRPSRDFSFRFFFRRDSFSRGRGVSTSS